jgi:hypothetical protein
MNERLIWIFFCLEKNCVPQRNCKRSDYFFYKNVKECAHKTLVKETNNFELKSDVFNNFKA